jgi:hypothetical protein
MSEVDSYISEVDPNLRSQFEKLRSLVKKALPGASESIKWSVPYYTLNGVAVASIAEYSKHVNLYLIQGAKLSSSLLEGTGKGMRHVSVETSSDIDETEILRLLWEAGKLTAATPRKNGRAKAR